MQNRWKQFKLFGRIAKVELLILDDFWISNLDKQQQMDLMENIEDRHGKISLYCQSTSGSFLV